MAGFDDATKKLEIKHALDVIDLLSKWNGANDEERGQILADPMCEKLLTQYSYPADDIVWRLKKAVDVYAFKPRGESVFDFAMMPEFDCMPIYAPKRDVEEQETMDVLDLLREYVGVETDAERDAVLKKLDKYSKGYSLLIKKYNMSPMTLFMRVLRAFQLNKYRPKNMNFHSFVFDDDLYKVGGEFDTFDLDISRDLKNNADPAKIREKFNEATDNRFTLANQFTNDWIVRLQKHPELVQAAKDAGAENGIDAYTRLFQALANDFCDDYHLPYYLFKIIVTNNDSGLQDTSDASHVQSYTLSESIRSSLNDRDLQAFYMAPAKFQGARKLSKIYVNLKKIAGYMHDNKEFFYKVVSVFAHEMNHALDYMMPRMGALGPQVQIADDKTYDSKDKKAYRNSATEMMSYELDFTLFDKLKEMDL